MAWRIACFCGRIVEGVPPLLCECGEIVEDPRDRDWLERMREEIGNTTTPPEGGAW